MYWRRAYFSIDVGGQPMFPTTTDLLIEQRLGWNTIAHVRAVFPYHQADNPRLYREDTLVRVMWGVKPDELDTWWGYIHHADVDTASPERPGNVEIRYVLVGTGHVMTDHVRKVWREQTDSGIAREIAKKHGLSSVVHKTSYVHPYLYQDSVSDYDFLTERAVKAGRKLHVENGVLYFIDVAAWAAARRPVVPRFDNHKDPTKPTDTLRFQAQVGGDLPAAFGRQLRREIFGVDERSGKLITNKNSDTAKARRNLLADDRPDSMGDLNYRLSGHTAKTQEWVTAQADLAGSVRLYPGQPLDMTGRAIPRDLRGRWIVDGAQHYLRSYGTNLLGNSVFSSRVELARNLRDDYAVSDRSIPMVDDACTPSGSGWKSRSMRHVTLAA